MSLYLIVILVLSGGVVSEGEFRDVYIEQGRVRGFNADDASVFSFYGIPYASAPTGEDLFKAPLPPPSWNETFEATERNIICPQRDIFSDTFLNLMRTVDCLRMNIFTPNTQETNLPVMVYIHGGGFQEGYGMIYSPIPIVKKGVIAVNFNYRLGVHGFLCLGTELAPGNAGFKDIIAALRWVHTNIRDFGGDPNNVSLGGSSAGGMAVLLTMLSPMSKGLFAKASSESGASLNMYIRDPLSVAESFANQFGVTTNQNITALDIFYRSLNYEQLNTGYTGGMGLGFFTCIETHNIFGVEKFLDKRPIEIVKGHSYEPRPYLTGFTSMEGLEFMKSFEDFKPAMEVSLASFLPEDLEYKSDEHKREIADKIKDFYFPTGEITYTGFVHFFTDSVFAYPQIVSARMLSEDSPSVYLHVFQYNGTVNLPSVSSSPIWGPGHVAQSLYTQNYDYRPIYDRLTEEDIFMQERLLSMWTNFFKYSTPIPTQTVLLNENWSPMTEDAEWFLEIDMNLKSGTSPLHDRVALWDDVYGNSSDAAAARYSLVLVLLASSFLINKLY